MFLRTPQLIRAVLFWCEFKDKKPPYSGAGNEKTSVSPRRKRIFFVIPHVMYWWMWHNLPDDLATDLHLHRTANYNQRQAFIQVNDVETKETDRTSSGHFLIDFFSHSNCSSSSRNLWGSGLSRVERQHHMNTYCVTDGCIVECPRSLCFKTMWAGRNSFKVLQDVSVTSTRTLTRA